MKKVSLIFILSFFLNLIWENLHSYFYIVYMGGEITETILLRASIADAIIIILLTLPFVLVASLRKRSWLIIPIGVLISICIELYALNTGRWAYNEYMPIIPILSVGLTPTIQLGLLGYLSYFVFSKQ
ncbi:MAG TPA: hypothetical protein DCZ84_02675 [Candidatus Vogelbacteria bacterium]|nr:MAG: seg [Parcubacteria group bacterium GW2011_GWC1_51_35]KKW23963.1 MAG: hypothetical protein UY68_C0016G0010 [Parcubacteria group bacterium GW2011_GWF2_52_12]KKW27552.1 MAG: hypothetical protein UY69_C0010G0008 [Parcubacteria group bacterium GW2011_GWF1_52_5]HBB65511.1 hypothetical protein [Candidatus Vogelbacteria bacterium]HCQ91961.1 hypothetical protein [Candidatus Vogelbacteria bacterium]